jgi:hypothetical protein
VFLRSTRLAPGKRAEPRRCRARGGSGHADDCYRRRETSCHRCSRGMEPFGLESARRRSPSHLPRKRVPPSRRNRDLQSHHSFYTATTERSSVSATATPTGAKLRQPGEPPEPQPDRRQQYVEDDQRETEEAPPQGPAPEGHGRLRFHLASGAAASALRPSTVRRIRCAVSSIDSSEMSITGQPSRRCTAAASSSSSYTSVSSA